MNFHLESSYVRLPHHERWGILPGYMLSFSETARPHSAGFL
jgi:hypothetical protein